jgi:hypothetical protein
MLAENTNMNFNLLTFWPVLFVSFCSFSAKKNFIYAIRGSFECSGSSLMARLASVARLFLAIFGALKTSRDSPKFGRRVTSPRKTGFPLGNFFGDGEKLTGWAQILIQHKEKSFLVC